VIRLVVLMYVRFPLSLRNVEDLLFEPGIDIWHKTVRLWWNRFGSLFAGDIAGRALSNVRGSSKSAWLALLFRLRRTPYVLPLAQPCSR